MKNAIYIGSLILERLTERGMSKAEFARRINCSRSTVYNILKNKTIDIELLLIISKVLDFDFVEKYKEVYSCSKSTNILNSKLMK